MAQNINHQADSRVRALLERPNPLLFAGAGVGCRVGFPTWDAYIETLAKACETFGDPESAVLVRKRLEQRNHVGAASVFKTSTLIPEGERWKAMTAPLAKAVPDAELDKLVPLVQLPFLGIVTTNYERSLHDACARARGRWVLPIERDTLSGASLSRDFFVARIHGNVEDPSSIVLETSDYQALRHDPAYLDFLIHILTTRSCLFVGFSFIDPAISQVLSVYAERFGPLYPSLHTALVPEVSHELALRLRQLNIEVVSYSDAGGHAELWRIIREVSTSLKSTAPIIEQPTPDAMFAHAPVHRFIAFTYAQARLRNDATPVADVAQDGVVASILSSQADGVMTEAALVTATATALRLSESEAQRLVTSSLDRLASRDQILKDVADIAWVGAPASELEVVLTQLARDVMDRACVREGVEPTDADRSAAKILIEDVLMSRAWDIAAHFAGGNSTWTSDVRQVVRQSILRLSPTQRPKSPTTLERAVQDLFRAPDTQEAAALTNLGRAAFGLQLLLASPRQTLFHERALPRNLYFDSNVLMPAITAGHPLRPVYLDVIERLRGAADKAGFHLRLLVGEQFLNEIVSHRRLAIDTVAAANLDDVDNLRHHVQFHSAVNTNVFIGAYGTMVGRSGRKITFAEFLAQVAPFDSEEQLAIYLDRVGVQSVTMDFRTVHNSEYVSVFNSLKQVYEDIDQGKDKASVLVQHEAQQLTRLLLDAVAGDSSLFVTADRYLRRALTVHSRLRRLSGMTVSHLGLVALADVMVGLSTDARSLARLVWAAPFGDEERALFDYFVTLGLREYEEGLATELQNLAHRSSEEASGVARAERISLFGKQPDDVARTSAFLDRFEDRFYEYWHEAIGRRRKSGQ